MDLTKVEEASAFQRTETGSIEQMTYSWSSRSFL